MLARGIYPPPSQFEAWFLSAAHTAQDVDQTIAAAQRAAMKDGRRKLIAAQCDRVDQRRIQPHAEHRAGRQLDVLALGRRDRPAAADEDAGQRAFGAAENRRR